MDCLGHQLPCQMPKGGRDDKDHESSECKQGSRMAHGSMPHSEGDLLLGSSQTPHAGLGVPFLQINFIETVEMKCLFLSEIS